MKSDREQAQEICEMTSHHFVETYYGVKCEICGLFYPDGCAPWDNVDDEDDEDTEAYDE